MFMKIQTTGYSSIKVYRVLESLGVLLLFKYDLVLKITILINGLFGLKNLPWLWWSNRMNKKTMRFGVIDIPADTV